MFRILLGAILLWPLFIQAQGQQRSYEWVQEVFTNLVGAYGRVHPSPPDLVITPIRGVIAEAKDDGRIFIGKDFVELCRSLGADSTDAMAMVLSHELAHHYNHHFWSATYGSAFADSKWGQKIDSLGSATAFRSYYESQADDFGLFYSYLAGYETFQLAEKVYNAIYSHFELPEQLPGYPSREERIQIAQLASERMQELVPIFESGKYLYLISTTEKGAYKQQLLRKAEQCYTTLLDRNLVSREIYNAIGVIYLQSALAYLDPKEHPFTYPIVLDEESRILQEGAHANAGKSSGFGESEAMAQQMLDKAIYYLDEATDLDRAYGIGFLNIAIAHTLQASWTDARYFISKAEQVALANKDHRLEAFCWEVKGILDFNQQQEDPIAAFIAAQELGSPTALQNRSIAEGKVLPNAMPGFGGFGATTMELIEGLDVPSIFEEVRYQLTAKDRYTVGPSSYLFRQAYLKGEVFIVECNDRECPYGNLVFYQTEVLPASASAKGITGGDNIEQLIERYGQPKAIISTGTYEYFLYKEERILFQIGKDNTVQRWIIYYFV